MGVLRAYSERSAGTLVGRQFRRGDPFIGGLIAAGAPLLKKFAGKALGKLTGGRLIGAGGATAIAKKVGGAAVGFGGAVAASRVAAGKSPFGSPFGGGKKYRRMNAGNAKALRRAFRRIDAFGKLAAKAGYVRRPRPSRKAKVC